MATQWPESGGEGLLGAVRLAFRCELRRRWRAWMAVAVLVSVVGGIVLAAAARCRAGYRVPSVRRGSWLRRRCVRRPSPADAHKAARSELGLRAARPRQWSTHLRLHVPDQPEYLRRPRHIARSGTSLQARLRQPPRPEGCEPGPGVVQSRTGRSARGDRHPRPLYSGSQASAFNNATGAPPKPAGPDVALRVVGFEASEFEFPSGSTPSYDVYTTQAFARTVLPRTAFGYVFLVRLRGGAAALPRFEVAAHRLAAAGILGVGGQDQQAASVEASIHPQAVGWWILALLAALVGLAVVGQALARQSVVEGEGYPTLAVLGADRRQLVTLGLARNLAVALAGAAGAVLISAALSPIAPLGEARIAETSNGVSFDPLVLFLGALAIVVVVIALGAWPAVRMAARPSLPDDRGSPRPFGDVPISRDWRPPARWSGSTTPCSAGAAGPASQWPALCSARFSP